MCSCAATQACQYLDLETYSPDFQDFCPLFFPAAALNHWCLFTLLVLLIKSFWCLARVAFNLRVFLRDKTSTLRPRLFVCQHIIKLVASFKCTRLVCESQSLHLRQFNLRSRQRNLKSTESSDPQIDSPQWLRYDVTSFSVTDVRKSTKNCARLLEWGTGTEILSASHFSLGLGILICLQTKARSLGTNTAPISNLSHVYLCGKFRSTWNVFIRVCKWEFRCFVTFLFSRRPRATTTRRLGRAQRTLFRQSQDDLTEICKITCPEHMRPRRLAFMGPHSTEN